MEQALLVAEEQAVASLYADEGRACSIVSVSLFHGWSAPDVYGQESEIYSVVWDNPPFCGGNGPGLTIFRIPVLPQNSQLTTSLLDPVPTEVTADGINPDANALASISNNTVVGIAADGAAEAVLEIQTPSAGTAVQLSLANESNNPAAAGSGNAFGYLTTLLPSDPSASTAAG